MKNSNDAKLMVLRSVFLSKKILFTEHTQPSIRHFLTYLYYSQKQKKTFNHNSPLQRFPYSCYPNGSEAATACYHSVLNIYSHTPGRRNIKLA